MDDDIVISGISGRFPESNNLEEFKKHLFDGVDLITEDDRRGPPGLYGSPARTGKLRNLDHFDASFFGVHGKQAHQMDPQLRILLETTFEAILDAGINPSELRGSKTGVFIGVSESESSEAWINDTEKSDGYCMLGTTKAMFANRISYTFNLRGPSFSVDAACSSSLVALQRAFESIRAGECTAAIIGGCNICLKQEMGLKFFQLAMTSAAGKCKVFDSSADGYARSEAVATIFIQKASLAKRIYATIIDAKTNCDGYKHNGITYPSGEMQTILIKELYDAVGIDPSGVDYIEAHGTGTKIGDIEETNSIAEVFCKNRSSPLLIGSVKSNMGHSEPTSGLCSLAKVILAMENQLIPANLHYKNPNSEIPALADGRLKVVTTNEHWEGGLVGVNSFGFGGSNVHVLLRSNQKPKEFPVASIVPRLILVSGRTKNAVEHLLDKVQEHKHDSEFLSLLDGIHSKNLTGHDFRGYTITGADVKNVMPVLSEKRPIWFVYSGMGSQYPEIAKNLMQIEVFKNSIQKLADILEEYDVNLHNILTNSDIDFNNVSNSFIAITSVQIALTDVLRSLGIEPDGIVGHSHGEIGSAYADGALTAEQAILISYYRGRGLLETNLKPGAMASIGITWDECRKLCSADIFPVCHNSRDNVTVAGLPKDIEEFVKHMQTKNIFAKMINSSGYAFHSKYIEESQNCIRKYLQQLISLPKPRSPKWISCSIQETAWNTPLAQTCSADYFMHSFISPVLFLEAFQHVPENAITIEISPNAILQTIIKRNASPATRHTSLMKRTETDQVKFFLENIGKLYISGAQPQISHLYYPVSYPVGRGTPMINSLIEWDHSAEWTVPNFTETKLESSSQVVTIDLDSDEHRYLAGHVIDGRILFPAAGYLVVVWKAFAKLKSQDFNKMPVRIQHLKFTNATIMPKSGRVKFIFNILNQSGEFNVSQGESLVASGRIAVFQSVDQVEIDSTHLSGNFLLNSTDIYKELRLRGYAYKGLFCNIVSSDLSFSDGMLKWEQNWISYIDGMLQFHILASKSRDLCVPTKLNQIVIDPLQHGRMLLNEIYGRGVPISIDREVGLIRSGGIKISGVKVSLAPRNMQLEAPPQLETYNFVPLYNIIADDDKDVSQHLALTIVAQIIIENNSVTDLLKIVEVPGKTCLAPILHRVFKKQPATNCDYSVVNTREVNAAALKKVGIRIIERIPNTNVLENGAHLILLSDAIQNLIAVKQALSGLNKLTGFLLLEENISEKFDDAIANDLGLVIVCIQSAQVAAKKYILLRRVVNCIGNPTLVHISGNNFHWVEPLKSAMKRSEEDGSKVYLVAQGDSYSGIVGMVNCLRMEPGGKNIRSFLIHNTEAKTFEFSLQFYSQQLQIDLAHNVLNERNEWGTFRHLPIKNSNHVSNVQHAYINSTVRGDLSSLKWIESPLQHHQDHEDFCWIYYGALNFRDIMLATGTLPPDALPDELAAQDCLMGLEFSGCDRIGKRVMGILPARGLATSCIADPKLIWEVPDHWSLAEAATVPVAYATSYYALIVHGRMRTGESVLIHSGSGAVGQAAITIALNMNCTVFSTVGSIQKRSFLKQTFPSLHDNHIGCSRNDSFENLIMKQTNGRGVDLVLNSLTAELQEASIRCLAKGGRFLEIGKVDLVNGSLLDMNVFLKSTLFKGVLLEDLSMSDKNELLRLLKDGIHKNVVKPITSTVFCKNEIQQAFRFMASGKHIGKVLLKVRDEDEHISEQRFVTSISRKYMDPTKSYIVHGGLGGAGLELTYWLISRGAKKIILTSRSGITTGYQSLCLNRWKKAGVTIVLLTHDPTNIEDSRDLLSKANDMGAVDGIFNLAMVLRDGMIDNLSASDFEDVAKVKIGHTKYLDVVARQLAPNLRYFVAFSSISSGYGNTGQSSYGYANWAMERIVEKRRADGIPGIAIQWGVIGGVGYAAEKMGTRDIVVGRTIPQSIASCLASLDMLLNQNDAVVSSFIMGNIETLDESSKTNIVSVVGNILGIKDPSSVSQTANFVDFGMDSLMVSEIKQTLQQKYALVLSISDVRGLTFDKLIDLRNKGESPMVEKHNRLNLPDQIIPTKVILDISGKSPDITFNPVFAISAIEGDVKALQNISEFVKAPTYGLQCTTDCPVETITKLAGHYINYINFVQKQGPFVIIGYSFGACVAFEMGLQLEARRESVKLVLVDGSHCHMVDQLNRLDKAENVKQSKILSTIASQFQTFEHNMVIQELAHLDTLQQRIIHLAEMLSSSLPYTYDDIKTVIASTYHKISATGEYKPATMFNGQVTLIKAQDSKFNAGIDYGLYSVCKQDVKILTLKGNHYTILEQEDNCSEIANIVNEFVSKT